MKKTSVIGLIACVLSQLMAGPAAAGSETEGSFTATALPYADHTYNYPTTTDTYTCFDGQEGVHKVFHPFTAPRDGVFRAWIKGFEGDWDIALFMDDQIEEMPWQTQWLTQEGHEVVSRRVREGTEVVIGVCNWSSAQTEIEVNYELARESQETREDKSGFTALRPGRKALLEEKVPVNFVFLGYDEKDIDNAQFLGGLPREYRPLVRVPAYLYGVDNYLGIRYTYDYRMRFTDRSYEDRFFRFLANSGEKDGPNDYQALYNAQASNVRDIKSNHKIKAPDVERWLVENPPAGVDPEQDTVVFINWFGRKDFRHHTYVKPGEPDTDSGFKNATLDSQATIAWGGTPPDDPESGFGRNSRLWFYDLSAGPEYWSGNYLVDVKDTDGDGVENYRMPPSWEYTKKGYRSPRKISSDLSKVARYIAIDLLFTTSPLYTPALNAPKIPETVNLDLNTYEGAPGFDASEEWVDSKEVLKNFRDWLPFYELSVDEQDRDFFETQFAKCYFSWAQLYYGPGCYEDRPYSLWANFFTHNALSLSETADDKKVDYEASAFNYVTPEGTGYTFGYADDNYLDGTQSFTHTFVDTQYKEYLGMTDIIIHEFGHHFGGSHPHDGYDYEDDRDFGGWYDKFAFTWVGTQNNSIMSYLSTNNEFSQFDRDNVARWMTSSYLNALNDIADPVVHELGEAKAIQVLEQADRLAAQAESAFASHRYLDSTFLAKQAYELGYALARQHGITVKGNWTGTKVLGPGEQAASQGEYTDESHRRYHRMIGDRLDEMIPPEILEAVGDVEVPAWMSDAARDN